MRIPTKVDSLDGIVIKKAALGSDHSMAVTGIDILQHFSFVDLVFSCFLKESSFLYFSPDGGEVLSWGDGRSGRLGHGHESTFLGFLKSTRYFT